MNVSGCDVCVSLMCNSVPLPYFSDSPLACGVVDLIALATTYRDGVKGLEGAQTHTRDGHKARGKHYQDSLGVVEGH